MLLVLKPTGRGKWSPLIVQLTGKRADPLLFQPGQRITLAGVVYRVCKVQP